MANRPEIFISYLHWYNSTQNEENSHYYATLLHEFFVAKDYKVVLDKVNLEFGGRISEFTENHDIGKYIILIIDDKYLRVPSSLLEILALSKYEDIYDRVFLLVLNDVRFHQNVSLIDYNFYWDERISHLKNKLKQITNTYFYNTTENELKFYLKLRMIIGNFSAFSSTLYIGENNISEIQKILFNTFESKFESDNELSQFFSKPKLLNHCPYYSSKNLIGRKNLLDSIESELINNQSLCLVNSLSGIGKTTIAKAYINNEKYAKQYRNIAWITLYDNLQEDFLDQLGNETIDFVYNQEQDTAMNFKYLLKKISATDGNNLLVIDNVTNIADIELLINKINSPKWHFLMLCQKPPRNLSALYVDVLQEEEAKNLFYRFYKREQNDMMLEHLIRFVDYHTTLIEVMAKVASCNNRLTIIKLYEIVKKERLRSSHIDNKLQNPDAHHTQAAETEQMFINFLSAIIETEQFNFEEEKYLRYFAILPSIEIEETQLLKLFQIKKGNETDFFNKIDSLVKRGWLQNNQNMYIIHSLIQPVVIKYLQPDSHNCIELINSFIDRLDNVNKENIYLKKSYLPFAEKIVGAIKDYDLNLALLASRIANFYLMLENYEKCLEYNHKVLEINEKLHDSNHQDIADICNKISIIYGLIGNYKTDLEFGLRAMNIRRKILKPNDPDIAQSYNNIAITYRALNDYTKAIKYHLRDVKICEEILEKNNPNLAVAYYETSVTYYYLKDYKFAKHYIDKAVAIWELVYPPDYSDLKNALEIQEIIRKKSLNEYRS